MDKFGIRDKKGLIMNVSKELEKRVLPIREGWSRRTWRWLRRRVPRNG